MTVDGTDCPIQEPAKMVDCHSPLPFDKKWFSHKFRSSGVRYEVAVCIATGEIVWVNGPFPCGQWPDVRIFSTWLKHQLLPGECVEVDRGYRGHNCAWMPDNWLTRSEQKAKANARARHEAVNSRLKNFKCLSRAFRHDLHDHKSYFALAAVVTQLMFEEEGPVFYVRY